MGATEQSTLSESGCPCAQKMCVWSISIQTHSILIHTFLSPVSDGATFSLCIFMSELSHSLRRNGDSEREREGERFVVIHEVGSGTISVL